MNRPLKFRAWDKTAKKMLFFEGISNQCPYNEASTFPQYESIRAYHELELMECTRLPDSHGKEIYEGDIVRSRVMSNEAEWETWAVEINALSAIQSPHGKAFDNAWIEHYVIGNIYENPELLTQ